MRAEIEGRMESILRVLHARQRMPGYITLKTQLVLPHLSRALEKIEEDTYGACDDCGDDISEERLIVVPGAIRCVPCQTAFELRPT